MTTEPQARSIAAVVSDAMQALLDLVRSEAALARAEIKATLRKAAAGLVLVLLAALNVLAGAAVAALVAAGLTAGWAVLAIAAVLLLVAAILAALGLRALAPSNLTLRRTARNVRRDARTLKETLIHDTTS